MVVSNLQGLQKPLNKQTSAASTVHILQIVHGGKVLQFSQTDLLLRNFSNEIACAVGFGYTRLTSNHKNFPELRMPQKFSICNVRYCTII